MADVVLKVDGSSGNIELEQYCRAYAREIG